MTAGSGLRVVNHLGVSATVLVNGRGVGTVPAEDSVRLTLAAATTTVRLAPVCPVPLLSLSGTLTVAVTTGAAPVTGGPSAGPTGTPSPPPTTAPPAAPGSAPPRPQPTLATPGPDASPPAPVRTTGPAAPPSAIRRRSGSPASTARAVAAAVAPEVELPGTVPATPSGPPPRANQPYIGPVAPLGADRAARYSLALIATVLILGTGLAALRLLHSQRHVGAHRRVR
jgi:hypothetical protein